MAQPAEIQEGLFPDFAVVADELALNWEQGLAEAKPAEAELSAEQKARIEALDRLILAISGPENLRFWVDDALRTFGEWDEIRAAAAEAARAFGWPVTRPPPSPDLYIGRPETRGAG